jgi:hypothetical protein
MFRYLFKKTFFAFFHSSSLLHNFSSRFSVVSAHNCCCAWVVRVHSRKKIFITNQFFFSENVQIELKITQIIKSYQIQLYTHVHGCFFLWEHNQKWNLCWVSIQHRLKGHQHNNNFVHKTLLVFELGATRRYKKIEMSNQSIDEI